MKTQRWQKIEQLFNTALALPAAEREAFLSSACLDDADLRSEVDSLLNEVDQPGDLLSQPAFTLGARLLAHDSIESLSGQRLAAYTIIKHLGSGGMGNVFLAEDPRLERLVALKLLPLALTGNAESVLRFQQEARAASAISHPHIAHIYEFGEVDNSCYLAMEYVEGNTLRELLKARSIDFPQALDFALQIGQALQAAHEAGVVHRDIKPENIMVRHDGYVKVLDFGLAKLIPAQNETGRRRSGSSFDTSPGLIMGTTAYMSPEQVRAEPVDARTDVWSWGVLLYEMIAGQAPFKGRTSSDVIASVLKTETGALLSRNNVIRSDLKPIFRKALAKEAEDRYTSIREAIADLQAVQSKLSRNGRRHGAIAARPNLQGINGSLQRVLGKAEGTQRSSADLAPQPKLTWRIIAVVFGVLLIAATLVMVQLRRAMRVPGPGPMQTIRPGNFGNVLDATISPDGNLIAFVSRNSGRYSLRIRRTDTNAETQLIPESEALCWGLRFSYDGNQVYYLITEKNSTISVLYRLDTNGGVPAKLSVNVDTPIALSPDGVRYAFCRRHPTQRKDALIVADADGAGEKEIAIRQHPDTFALTSAAWSPDGKFIVLGATTTSEDSFKLVGVSVSDGRLNELSPHEWTATRGFAWSRNGKNLFFIAGDHETPGLELWRLPYPGGEAVRLTNDPVNYEEISLTRDGKTMVAMQVGRPSNLWATSLPDRSSEQLLSGDGKELAGIQLLSGNRFAYTAIEKGLSNIWSADLGGGNPKQLTSAGASHPAASPDGEYLVFAGLREQTRHLWRLALKDGQLQQLTNGAGEDFPSFTPDGKWIVYTSLSADRYTLWRVPLFGGEVTQLTREGLATQPSVSPDGRLIACAYRTDSTTPWKIALVPSTGGTPTKTLSIPYAINQIIRWSPDSTSIFYLDSPKGVSNVWRLPLTGGPAEPLTHFSAESIFGYQISLDGKQLISARGTITRQVVIFTNPG